MFFFLFFCQPYLRLWNCKLLFLILKILQYGRSRWWVQLVTRYPCNFDIRIDISISIRPDHQIWQTGTSAGFDWNETNQAGAYVITSRSRDNWQHYVSTIRVPMATKLCRMVMYLDELLLIKSHDPFITWSCKITWQTKIIISPLPQCLWPPNLARW